MARMSDAAKPRAPRRRGKSQEPQVVLYRGIRIAPINGRRSPLSRLIREGLRARFEQPRDDATPA